MVVRRLRNGSVTDAGGGAVQQLTVIRALDRLRRRLLAQS